MTTHDGAILIVLPSWLGDIVMATPAIARVRRALPGTRIVACVRPGMDAVLEGCGLIDDQIVLASKGGKGNRGGVVQAGLALRAERKSRSIETAILFPNSFATAMMVRLSGIRNRVGYLRDGRGPLLTHGWKPQQGRGADKIVTAPVYYDQLVQRWLASIGIASHDAPICSIPDAWGNDTSLAATTLGIGIEQHTHGRDVLHAAGLSSDDRYAVLNPGGNNPAKRWPAADFARIAEHLIVEHDMRILVNGSPAEADVVNEVIALVHADHRERVIGLPSLGGSIGSLKHIVAHAALMVTNDTGPRHIAAAFGTPVVALFGPTDHRWTVLPGESDDPERPTTGQRSRIVVADPTLPQAISANDEPQRCAIDRIATERVQESIDELLQSVSDAAVV